MVEIELVIKIPEEQIKKSLEESKYIHEDEGEKGSVHIEMLYTNGQLEFVDVSRKTDFYSCKYKILPKGHGDLIDRNELKKVYDERITYLYALNRKDNSSREAKICATNWCSNSIDELPTIIEQESEE